MPEWDATVFEKKIVIALRQSGCVALATARLGSSAVAFAAPAKKEVIDMWD
jgi:hypothetical protein